MNGENFINENGVPISDLCEEEGYFWHTEHYFSPGFRHYEWRVGCPTRAARDRMINEAEPLVGTFN